MPASAGWCCVRAAGTSSAWTGRQRARRRRRDDQRAGAMADQSRPGRSRSVGRHAGHGRRRHLRQRALGRTPALGSGRRRASGDRRRRSSATCPPSAMEFGYDRSRLQRTGEVLLSALFAVSPGDSGSTARDGARVAGVSASGRSRWRRPAPAASSRTRPPTWSLPPGVPASAGRVDRPRGAQGRRRRWGAGVADARQLHRERGDGDGRRHSRAGRTDAGRPWPRRLR